PPGARVLLDGREVGVTPIRLPNVAPGSHNIRVELRFHQPYTATVQVRGGQQARVAASLQPTR
ncbi:MAG: PEGA domain-containing protein, partial [Acidobacteriota bacterium]|nr:PEGA domain-containing protein [Acidobacteriota bacterium]